jgi:hypothetical protein
MKIYLRINNTAKIYIAGVSFLKLPQIIFISTYEIIPRRIPFEIEYENGIITIQTNAGTASEKSSNGICVIGVIIKRPTIISAGAVAAAGIERKSGEKKSATAKQHAIENAVRPERPPCATPAALSTYVVVVDVPRIAPTVVAIASAINACLRRRILPFSSTICDFVHTPMSVPTVSNISIKKKVKTIINISIEKM